MIGNTLENTPLKIAIVAGERSGDELGAPLMKSLKSINPSIEFIGVGGSKMTSEGLESYFDMREISVMGIIEPLLNLRKLLKLPLINDDIRKLGVGGSAKDKNEKFNQFDYLLPKDNDLDLLGDPDLSLIHI